MRLKHYLIILSLMIAIWIYGYSPSVSIQDAKSYHRVSDTVHIFDGYTLTHLADYEGQFRVLSREDYRFGREAELSPVDFALGWDKMAEPSVYKQLSIRQSNRWYYWRYENQPPIPVNEIISSSANTHIIPANATVAQQLAVIDQDDLIYLKGYLVEVTSADGWTWRSSLTREDTGGGACELMLVNEVRKISSL